MFYSLEYKFCEGRDHSCHLHHCIPAVQHMAWHHNRCLMNIHWMNEFLSFKVPGTMLSLSWVLNKYFLFSIKIILTIWVWKDNIRSLEVIASILTVRKSWTNWKSVIFFLSPVSSCGVNTTPKLGEAGKSRQLPLRFACLPLKQGSHKLEELLK